MKDDSLTPAQAIIELLALLGVEATENSLIYQVVALGLIYLIGWIFYKIAQRGIIAKLVESVVKGRRKQLVSKLMSNEFFRRSARIIPALVMLVLAPYVLEESPKLMGALNKVLVVYMLIVVQSAIYTLINSIAEIYRNSDMAKRVSITGVVQLAKITTAVTITLISVAVLMDTSLTLVLSGLGAVAAILSLMFKDTILGFVAGMQIAANDMLNIDDWIDMPQYGVSGTVMDVALTTVKIRNWDKSISTVPSYSFITEPVKNWRGMTQSGGRRIKRSIIIDIKFIRYCDEDMLESFKQVSLIKDYMLRKEGQLQSFNQQHNIADSPINSRRLTNIGTYRAYAAAYLAAHPEINQEMSQMVRLLEPTTEGLPVEIYCFTKSREWEVYENIQSDIFDHLLAVVGAFQLRAYQRGSDILDVDLLDFENPKLNPEE